MKIGCIGLGRMGQAMVLHLLEQGIDVVAYNRSREKTDGLVVGRQSLVVGHKKENQELRIKNQGANVIANDQRPTTNDRLGILLAVYTIEELVKQLPSPRVVWLMVDHGKPVDDVIEILIQAGIGRGDIVIDGGNSFYKDSVRRHESLAEKGIHFLDVGTSGGIEGARNGACLMIGGEKEVVERLTEFWDAAAMPGGWTYFGPSGAGHFVKMVHNGVEYGMLQAIGEGFEILEKGPYSLDLHSVAANWTKGSVVRGWLMDLLERALKTDHSLSAWDGTIGGGSTGEWTQKTAKEFGADIPVIDASMDARKTSQTKPSFSGKVVAALRNQFGGHVVEKK